MVYIKKLLLMLCVCILLTGCSFSKEKDNISSFIDFNKKKDTYKIKGEMSLVSDEDTFNYDLEVSVYDQDYYKVSLSNKLNNHEQIILKNDEGVYV